MKRGKSKSGKNTKFAIIFFVLIGVIVMSSLIYKAVSLVARSRFDNHHRFNVLLSDSKNIKILSFAPDENLISSLQIKDSNNNLDIYKFLEIPIDATILTDSENFNKDIPSLLGSAVLNYKDNHSGLTVVDVIRLLLFAKTVKTESVHSDELATDLDESERDKILAALFEDDKISNEKVSIEIINAAGEQGLGNRIARLITNMGGNVLIVSTSSDLENKSYISYKGKKIYTLEKLKNLLGFEMIDKNQQEIGDITIRLGKDYQNYNKY